ncbi:PEP-utilizing enzyme [Gemmiger formicilis]|uniref:PEP-utilizing enzyme n=1 Tax=Gemmiger formicilis TaxID=745368 RepID=UPI0035225D77
MQARAADVQRCQPARAGQTSDRRSCEGGIASDVPVLLVAADDLAPTETDPAGQGSKVLGFITAGGSGSNAHTAILARTLGIPAIVSAWATRCKPELEGTRRHRGRPAPARLVIDPDDADPRPPAQKAAPSRQRLTAPARSTLKGQPNVTKDGRTIRMVYCNIGSPADVACRIAGQRRRRHRPVPLRVPLPEHGSDYPDRGRSSLRPTSTVAELTWAARTCHHPHAGHRRGQAERTTFHLHQGGKPRDGSCARIRICLTRPEVFQHPAARPVPRLRVSASWPLCSRWSPPSGRCREAKRICRSRSARELAERRRPRRRTRSQLGIMIETPAAAINSAPSGAVRSTSSAVGTNDLTQYTLAL